MPRKTNSPRYTDSIKASKGRPSITLYTVQSLQSNFCPSLDVKLTCLRVCFSQHAVSQQESGVYSLTDMHWIGITLTNKITTIKYSCLVMGGKYTMTIFWWPFGTDWWWQVPTHPQRLKPLVVSALPSHYCVFEYFNKSFHLYHFQNVGDSTVCINFVLLSLF